MSDIKDIERTILNYLRERKWDELKPGDLSKSVAIEAGELLELFQWENPTLADVKNNPEKIAAIKKELADVLIYCFDLAVLLELDVEEVIMEKLKYVMKKYPAELFQNRVKEPGTEDIYWKIKKEYRQKAQ